MARLAVNHVSVHAEDLATSTRFYVELLGAVPIPTPRFGSPVQWLALGAQQLHLFVRPGVRAPAYHHLGITVEDFHEVLRRVRALHATDPGAIARPLSRLPDGAVQLYVRDPAGNLVELNWPDADTLDPAVVGELRVLADHVPQTADSLRATLFHRPIDPY
jgi:catechol 2,3-dioxygenase-like lactoylglutathione lyase family enzyme